MLAANGRLASCAPLSTGPRRWEGAAGLDLKLHGFSHKLPALARFIATSLAGLGVEPEAFARVKEALLRNVRGRERGGRGRASLLARRRQPGHPGVQLTLHQDFLLALVHPV